MSKLFRIFTGNPPSDKAHGVVKSPEGSPIIGGMDSNKGSSLYYDLDGNMFIEASKTLFIKGKKIFEELESSNIVIADAYAINALNIALTSIENILIAGKEINVSSTNLTLSVDGTTQVLSPKVILGKINKDILNGEADGEVYEDNNQLYNENSVPDPVMTKRRFSTWWNKRMGDFINEFNKLKENHNALVSKYNSHKNAGQPIDPTDILQNGTVTTDDASKVKNVGSMQASKTTSAI